MEVLDVSTERYPICVIIIEVDARDLDVNLDPNKQSVMIRTLDELTQALETKLKSYYGIGDFEVIKVTRNYNSTLTFSISE